MRVIIAGSRDFDDYGWLSEVMYTLFAGDYREYRGLEVITGYDPDRDYPPGPDKQGYRWAKDRRLPVQPFPADWDTHGPAAGPIRNRSMAAYAAETQSALVAFWDGESRGTKSMIHEAARAGVDEIHVYKFA